MILTDLDGDTVTLIERAASIAADTQMEQA
jgi:hypothetical protein